MTARRQLYLWAPFALAGVILIAWFFVWRAGAEAMRKALADFAADQAEDGGSVTYAPMRARGFPFFLRGEADDVAIARGGYRLETQTLYLHATPFDPGRVVFSTTPLLQVETPKGVYAVRAEDARASIERNAGAWLFKAEALAIEATKGDEVLKTGRSVLNVAPSGSGAYQASFRILGAHVANKRGEASIARLDAALTASGAPLAVTLHGLDGEIGGARIGLEGALARDNEGFLAGRLDAAIENPAALAAALSVLGAVKPEHARALDVGLQLLASAGGGRIAAPLDFKDGDVRIAGVKIAPAPRFGQP